MEEFVNIPGYNGYKVNRLGQVMGLRCILNPCITRGGYEQVICMIDKRRITMKVHTLVALTFIPNPDNKPQIDHIDRNKLNNNINNLRWATRSENCLNRHHITTNTGNKFIRYISTKNLYKVEIRKLSKSIFCKYFKTLPEAIAARDEFLNNNNLG